MGIYIFAKKMFDSTIKNSIFYMISIVMTTAFLFNAVNISYNKVIYSSTQTITQTQTSYQWDTAVVQTELSVNQLQQQNLFLLLVVTALFAVFCNMSHIKRKSKEIAFLVSNGSSLTDVSRYLLYTNGRSYIIGSIGGVLLGICLIPLFNVIMYTVSDIVNGPIFYMSIEGVGISLAFAFLQFILVVILNLGFTYRKEVIELMKVEKTVSLHDNRSFKTPGFIFFLLFLIPIIMCVSGAGFQGVEIATYYLNYVGIVGLYGVIKYFIPEVVKKLNSKKLMYKGNRKIYVSNFLYSLKNSALYLIGMVVCLNYFIYSIVDYSDLDGMVGSSLFCVIGASLVIGLALVYNLLVDANDKVYIYTQLKVLGYTKKEIKEIILKESILFFTVGLALPLSIIACSLITYVYVNVIALSVVAVIVSIIVIPLTIAGIVSYLVNIRKIMSLTYGIEKSKENTAENIAA